MQFLKHLMSLNKILLWNLLHFFLNLLIYKHISLFFFYWWKSIIMTKRYYWIWKICIENQKIYDSYLYSMNQQKSWIRNSQEYSSQLFLQREFKLKSDTLTTISVTHFIFEILPNCFFFQKISKRVYAYKSILDLRYGCKIKSHEFCSIF